MVMSWRPGDFSTIHDHGYTQWGAVQVFGPAEHATFRIDDDKIATLARWRMKNRDVIGVHHDLLHQMATPPPAILSSSPCTSTASRKTSTTSPATPASSTWKKERFTDFINGRQQRQKLLACLRENTGKCICAFRKFYYLFN
jgi:hypothetical protein